MNLVKSDLFGVAPFSNHQRHQTDSATMVLMAQLFQLRFGQKELFIKLRSETGDIV